MKITSRRATLAQAEEDEDSEDELAWEEEDIAGGGGSGSTSEVSAFDVPSVPYIDDELAAEHEMRWPFAADAVRPHSASCRYVVVSGTPLKILEHLLSDLRLDDQRGAPESRESGECLDPVVTFVRSKQNKRRLFKVAQAADLALCLLPPAESDSALDLEGSKNKFEGHRYC